jgi:hypothetical protein
MACRGSGRVISKLGGETTLVTCPWCEGGGVRLPAIDAQAGWRARREREQGEGSVATPSEGDGVTPPATSAGDGDATPAPPAGDGQAAS